jgi:hypothetical protein
MSANLAINPFKKPNTIFKSPIILSIFSSLRVEIALNIKQFTNQFVKKQEQIDSIFWHVYEIFKQIETTKIKNIFEDSFEVDLFFILYPPSADSPFLLPHDKIDNKIKKTHLQLSNSEKNDVFNFISDKFYKHLIFVDDTTMEKSTRRKINNSKTYILELPYDLNDNINKNKTFKQIDSNIKKNICRINLRNLILYSQLFYIIFVLKYFTFK